MRKEVLGESFFHKRAGELALRQMKPISLDDVAREKRTQGGSLRLYVHIPFCTEICSFCAFHRQVGNKNKQETYTQTLLSHIQDTLPLFGKDQEIQSVYVGGGTPGLLTPDQAGRVLGSIKDTLPTKDWPVSYELHPENISADYIRALVLLGVTRFSVGVQNLSPKERAILKRTLTSADEDIARIQVLNDLGVDYNLDLMFGTPLQTMESWRQTLERIVGEVYPPEITTYQYVNAYGAEIAKDVEQGKIKRPDALTRRQMYVFTKDYLKAHGYRQIGPQNFGRGRELPGMPLLNHGNDFLGLGPRTYSRIGSYFFINGARTSDFNNGANTVNYWGIRLPGALAAAMDKGLDFFAGQKAIGKNNQTLEFVRSWQSEAIVQMYGALYYILNQPNYTQVS